MNQVLRQGNVWLWLLLGGFVWALVAREAARVPVTHDEVNTIALSQSPVWDIVTYKDPIPNNHILNTLFIKAEIGLLGDSLFVSRLHNVLAFLPFFVFTVLLARRLFQDSWHQLALVCLIVLQPYLLDFFAVARGYGLSVAFEMASLYFLFRRMNNGTTRDLSLSVLCAAVGVYANFTLLNLFFPLLLVLAVESWLRHGTHAPAVFRKEAALAGGITAILLLVSAQPFLRMMETKQFVYWGTAGFLQDTAKPLLFALRSGTEYFRWSNEDIALILLSLIGFFLLSALVLWRYQPDKRAGIVAFSLLGLTLLYNHVQFWFLDVPFLNARTALFLIPLTVICMAVGLSAWTGFRPMAGYALAVFCIALPVQHFVRGFNGKSVYEWYYDENTYDVLHDLTSIIDAEKLPVPVKLNCHWIFYPSLEYHIARQYPGTIELVPYHKEIDPQTDALFYYTQSDEVEALQERFGPVRDYGWRSRFLLRRK